MRLSLIVNKVCGKGFAYSNGTCLDFDECKKEHSNKVSGGYVTCSPGAFCSNNVGGFTCACEYGFRKYNDLISESTTNPGLIGDQCVDIDECSEHNVCQENAECHNTEGSYSCDCFDGYEGSLCEDIDECIGNNKCNARAECQNTDGNYTCRCGEGYFGTGYTCLRGQCQDTFCPDNQKCVSARTEECECKEGFGFNSDSSCVDINECEMTVCSNEEECANTVGSYTCRKAVAQVLATNTTTEKLITTEHTDTSSTVLTTVQTSSTTTQEKLH